MRAIWPAILVLACSATTSFAHYNILLPDKPAVKKGEKVRFTYQFGHPYEREMFDAPKPVGLVVLLPNGKKETLDIDKTLTKIEVPGGAGKNVTAWRFDYTPAERGDHVFVLKTPPLKHTEEGDFVEDIVKVVLHVQTQNGWDTTEAPYESGIDIRPYTRPYGLFPGMVFKGRVVRLPFKDEYNQSDLRFASNLHVEMERYNEKHMKILPPDELITFRTKSDPNGFFVVTFPDPGWWSVTALSYRNPADAAKDNRKVIQRATLWLFVDEKK